MSQKFKMRLAEIADRPAISKLMILSVQTNFAKYLRQNAIDAAAESMGIDETLMADGTYFVVEKESRIAACGGWGRRKTLFGKTGSVFHDDTPLNPEQDLARIRAIYTHPDFAGAGLASWLLEHCEEHAEAQGFRGTILGSTIPARSFYEKHGYSFVSKNEHRATNGAMKETIIMDKLFKRISA